MKTEYAELKAFLTKSYKAHKKACASYKAALEQLDVVAGVKKVKRPIPFERRIELGNEFTDILKKARFRGIYG